MKRIVMAAAALAVATALFAQEEDRVLEEARARARRPAAEREQPAEDPRKAESEGIRAEQGDDRAAKEESDIYLPIALSILPGSPIPGKKVDSTLGLGLLISSLDDVYGAQVSTIASVAEGRVRGFQGAYVFNVAQGGLTGFQGSYVFNVAGERAFGAQTSGVFNVSGGGGPLQAAGVFNVSQGSFYGLQAAGVFNVAEGDVRGVQAAGIFNVAKDLTGVQIGLVNVADNAVGFQLGLVNIVRNGIHDLGVWFEDSGYAYGFLQKGTSRFYTIFYAGAPREEWFQSAEHLAGGAGAGFRLGGDRRWEAAVDLDLSAKTRIDIDAIETAVENERAYRPTVFPSLRASLRLPVGLGLALHGGVVMDLECGGGPKVDEPFRESDDWSFSTFDLDWTVHPKLFIGFSL